MIYQFLLTQKKSFLMQKEMGVRVVKRSSIHHWFDSESLRPWHVSKLPCVINNLRYISSNVMQMWTVGYEFANICDINSD